MEIPTREAVKDMLSITSSVIKRTMNSVLANLLRRNLKPQAHHQWTDRQVYVTYLLETLEHIYNPVFLYVKS